MKCIICRSEMRYSFSKLFAEYSLSNVDYHCCPNCGFCASKTHFDMDLKDWEVLNAKFHTWNNLRGNNSYNRNQGYFAQGLMLFLLNKHHLLGGHENWLDWGCGEGNLSILLNQYFDCNLMNYDCYIVPRINSVQASDLEKRTYDLVVSTGVFEHVRARKTLDEIESHVSIDGCLGIHTLVCGEIPKDPIWMYLLPVHSSFFTNRSMQRLMEEWGYACSVYNPDSKMWIWFKKPPEDVKPEIDKLNRNLGWEYLHFKQGFMDYWP
ncbi:MAG: class I SAM-dependent methyltransferase [Anaerolineaceae bacterium]|nr:class I SAM-dependent methyltransferase [Anaerolineaceae bacterium]